MIEMIEEYALIPDLFDAAAYSKPDYIEMCLPHLKEALYQEAVIRDLSDGEWSRYCVSRSSGMHRLAKEILRKLKSRNRLRIVPRQAASDPVDAEGWCREALLSHGATRLSGIIAADQTKQQFRDETLVTSIEKLSGCAWWQARSCSVLLERRTETFLGALHRILECANSLMFIDPNLDPSSHNYREFSRLLTPVAERRPAPLIELHRSFCLGDGPGRKLPNEVEWRQRFEPLSNTLKSVGLSAEVFLWQDFHARYLITDLIGLVAEAGFDVTGAHEMTTWARLGQIHRDHIQRQFAPETRPDDLKFRFGIGASASTDSAVSTHVSEMAGVSR